MSAVPEIVIREYDPETGNLLQNVTSLAFGRVTRGAHTRVKVIDVAFTSTTSVSNLKLGLIGNAGINAVASDSGVPYDDGSRAAGHFGIESSQTFNPAQASQPLTRHFPGMNDTASVNSEMNVSVGVRATNISNFIYLDIEVGSTGTGLRSGAYKIFFDFT